MVSPAISEMRSRRASSVISTKRHGCELKWLGAREAASISRCWCSRLTGSGLKWPLVVERRRIASRSSIRSLSQQVGEQVAGRADHRDDRVRLAAGLGQGHGRERGDGHEQRGMKREHRGGQRGSEHDRVQPVMKGAEAGTKQLRGHTDGEVDRVQGSAQVQGPGEVHRVPNREFSLGRRQLKSGSFQQMRGSAAALRTIACSVVAIVMACAGRLDPPPSRSAEQFTQGRALVDLDALALARARADAASDDVDAQWNAGIKLARATLQGHVELRDDAERYLERAWRLDPSGERVPAAEVLARFLNIRSSVLDLDKIDLQIALYESLIEPEQRDRGPARMEAEQFHFASFAVAAEALRAYDQGRGLVALRRLAALERAMAVRAREHPEDIDSCAMAGNFELTFAGMVPVGVERRLARGVAYL